ncbi:type II secretion system F family protein [Nocardiopsis sp. CNR-923]|uniref:type II secretion system F family protein n=1 Tax=Nocardiopsis sp. CNR-923 TaxID=1904965 RepID=UPI0021CC53ED|nr:hypothetical protein [Nocardiopsis sp. CNR-923]
MPVWDWSIGGLAFAGAVLGAGVVCAAYALSLVPWRAVPVTSRFRRLTTLLSQRQLWIRAAGGAAAGVLVGVVTGWPVGVVLAAVAGWWMPALLGPDTTTRSEADLAEALASWAEQLRDMITGASGLHQAVTATVPVAPDLVRDQVQELEARLRAGQSMEQAAGVFARQVDSDLGDLIAITLTMGAVGRVGTWPEPCHGWRRRPGIGPRRWAGCRRRGPGCVPRCASSLPPPPSCWWGWPRSTPPSSNR